MVTLIVVVIDEGFDLRFQITRQEIVFQQDPVLQGLVPSLDFALGLGMIRRTAGVLHALVLQPLSQFSRDITGSVIAEQSWFVNDVNLVTSRRFQSQIQRVGHVFGPHVCAKLPRDDVAAVIIQDRAEIKPAPANDLEVSEVRLPQLVDGRCLVFELIGRLDHDEGRTGNQVVRFQDPIC